MAAGHDSTMRWADLCCLILSAYYGFTYVFVVISRESMYMYNHILFNSLGKKDVIPYVFASQRVLQPFILLSGKFSI